MDLKEKKGMGRMVLFPFTQLKRKKKNSFEKEENNGEDEEISLG